MKKIKYFVLAFAAVCLTVGLASCEKEKEVEKIVEKPVEVIKEVEVPVEVPQDNNWSRYQSIVTADVSWLSVLHGIRLIRHLIPPLMPISQLLVTTMCS